MFARVLMISLFSLSLGLFLGCGEDITQGEEDDKEAAAAMDPDGDIMKGAGEIKIDPDEDGAETAGKSAIPADKEEGKKDDGGKKKE